MGIQKCESKTLAELAAPPNVVITQTDFSKGVCSQGIAGPPETRPQTNRFNMVLSASCGTNIKRPATRIKRHRAVVLFEKGIKQV